MSKLQLTARHFLVYCFVFASHLLAEPAFFRKDIVISEFTDSVVAGDFNGDGRTDLAVGAQEGLFTLLNQGGGNFGRPIHTAAPPRTFWLSTSADFNGDGLDDLVGSGFLYLSRGDGAFLSPRYLGVQEAVAAADFNGDGKTDLLFSNWDMPGAGVRILLGNGDGTFRPGATVTPIPRLSVWVADFNGDGRTDVATDGKIGFSLLVFLSRRDGTFGPETRTNLVNWPLMADFDGDGRADLFIGSAQPGSGWIMLGKGDGSFESRVPYASNVFGYPSAAADFTADGYADLIINQTGRFYLCPGKGDGTLLPPVEQPVGLGLTIALTSADLDGDGRLDLVTAGTGLFYGSSIVSVLMSRAEGGPEQRRAVSTASYTAIVAPGSLATLFVPTGVQESQGASPPWPTQLGGISLEVHDSTGVVRMAPLLFVSPTQINFQVPGDTALGEATLVIQNAVQGSMQVDAVAPGLFTVQGGAAMTGVRVNHNGTHVPVAVIECYPGFGCAPSPVPLSTAGDRPIYLSFYATGFRGANTDNVTCSVTGTGWPRDLPPSSQQVPVVYAGPQQTPGVDQINIRLLPEVLETIDPLEIELFGSAPALVTIHIDGMPANPVYIGIR